METTGKFVLGTIAALLLFGLMTVFGWFFTVDQGERGLVLRYGNVVRVADPGLNFKAPWIETALDISIRTHKMQFEKLQVYSKDIQSAVISVAVNWRQDPAKVVSIYGSYGLDPGKIVIEPCIRDNTKVVFGRFNAAAAIQERGRLGNEMESTLSNCLKTTGILVDAFQIENIDFDDSFEKSVEERMKAEVEVAKLTQNLEREKVQADIARTQASGAADALRATARSEADAILMRAEAEAKSIRIRAEALAQNANLVELVKAERWDGKLPTTMLPGTSVPMVNLRQ